MRQMPIPALICVILASTFGLGQVDAPSFEVASVKPSSPAVRAMSCSGGPGTADPGIWRCSNVPLAFVISQAYGFEPYEFPIRAPCCLSRFDFIAKVPDGTTKEQFWQMMENLLKERFKLAFHRERKEMAIYELTVGEKGLRMKESAPDAPPARQDPWELPTFSIGKDGYPIFPAGHGGLAGPDGNYRWTESNLSMREIVKTLSFQLGRPVIDATGLKGKYDIDMKWWIDTAWAAEAAGLSKEKIAELRDSGPRGPSLERAVRDQLGLKLNSEKGFSDIIIIDHVEELPSEN
jgi:uncharacterized protein (TIGR03435 family)